jgi:AcrR family transcriptional regulator
MYIKLMGTKERKAKEKVELKDLILQAAKEVFAERGYQNTSIRTIADRIEYSPGTIYLYFKDKDAILHELQKAGFQVLKSKFMVLLTVEDPFERLKAMGKVYLGFAKEYPDYYDLMFIINAPMNALEEHECWLEGQSAFDLLIQVVQQCQQQGRFREYDAQDMAYVIWSSVHGMAALTIRGRCRVISEEKRDSIEDDGLEAFILLLSKS